ncbi:MAG: hypothetical protein EOP04_21895, partial [Proteobacteria bacterium]
MMKLILMTSLTVIAASCATTKSPLRPKHGKFEKDANATVGMSLKDLIKQMGYPERTLKSPDGNEVYEYQKNNGTEVTSESAGGGYTIPSGFGAGLGSSSSKTSSKVSNLSCVTWFELKEAKVVGVTWKGNDCVGYESAVACSGYGASNSTYALYPSEICSNPKKVLKYF